MTDIEIKFEDMVEPLERLFEREFPVDPFISASPQDTAAHFVFLEASSRLVHAVRIEKSYSDAIFDLHAGIHAAQDLAANQRWIALPLDEYRDGEEEYVNVMTQQCKSRGVGIITVQQKGKGLSAKVIAEPKLNEGDFVAEYPQLAERLTRVDPAAVAASGMRVVNTYD